MFMWHGKKGWILHLFQCQNSVHLSRVKMSGLSEEGVTEGAKGPAPGNSKEGRCNQAVWEENSKWGQDGSNSKSWWRLGWRTLRKSWERGWILQEDAIQWGQYVSVWVCKIEAGWKVVRRWPRLPSGVSRAMLSHKPAVTVCSLVML